MSFPVSEFRNVMETAPIPPRQLCTVIGAGLSQRHPGTPLSWPAMSTPFGRGASALTVMVRRTTLAAERRGVVPGAVASLKNLDCG